MTYRLICADVLDGLRSLPDESVQCVVTSPPYWGLRDYGVAGQLGSEPTVAEFVGGMVAAFAELRRVLRADGALWLNLGDSYAAGGNGARDAERWPKQSRNAHGFRSVHVKRAAGAGIKPKDLVGVPWRVAFALQADGWYLRSDIIWSKPNPMPESVTDRPTKAHEYLFLMSKSARYYYDADAIKERCSENTHARLSQNVAEQIGSHRANGGSKTNGPMKAVGRVAKNGSGVDGVRSNSTLADAAVMPVYERNKRSVWEISTESFSEAHFATFPTALVEPCILAGSRVGDTILDPFSGSGTTGVVALSHQRNYIGCELNPAYVEMSRRRLNGVAPLLAKEIA